MLNIDVGIWAVRIDHVDDVAVLRRGKFQRKCLIQIIVFDLIKILHMTPKFVWIHIWSPITTHPKLNYCDSMHRWKPYDAHLGSYYCVGILFYHDKITVHDRHGVLRHCYALYLSYLYLCMRWLHTYHPTIKKNLFTDPYHVLSITTTFWHGITCHNTGHSWRQYTGYGFISLTINQYDGSTFNTVESLTLPISLTKRVSNILMLKCFQALITIRLRYDVFETSNKHIPFRYAE